MPSDQWRMTVCNNGVAIAQTYGPLPVPSDDELREKGRLAAKRLPVNLWSY